MKSLATIPSMVAGLAAATAAVAVQSEDAPAALSEGAGINPLTIGGIMGALAVIGVLVLTLRRKTDDDRAQDDRAQDERAQHERE